MRDYVARLFLFIKIERAVQIFVRKLFVTPPRASLDSPLAVDRESSGEIEEVIRFEEAVIAEIIIVGSALLRVVVVPAKPLMLVRHFVKSGVRKSEPHIADLNRPLPVGHTPYDLLICTGLPVYVSDDNEIG